MCKLATMTCWERGQHTSALKAVHASDARLAALPSSAALASRWGEMRLTYVSTSVSGTAGSACVRSGGSWLRDCSHLRLQPLRKLSVPG